MAKIYNTTEVIKKFKSIHGDRYDYSKYIYPKRKELKGIVICKEHGEFETSRMHHEKGVGCPICAGVPYGGFKRKNREDFLSEMDEIFGNALDFSKFIYKNNSEKGIVICPIHGEFVKSAKHLMRGQGCPECSGKTRLTLNKIQKKIDDIYGPSHYTILPDLDYVNNKTNVSVWCGIHKSSWEVRPDNLLHSKTRCPKCAEDLSKIEKELRDYVISLGVDIVTNTKKIIHPLELDVYVPDKSLAIEMNGLLFHSESYEKSKEYHLNKTNRCKDLNIQLLHIFEDEWKNKQEIWKSIIKNKLGKNDIKYHARKCDITELSVREAATFLTNNHIQGYSKSSIRIGLLYADKLVSVLTMGKSRFDNNIEWEICRFANVTGSNVCGGFQRMLSHFIRTYNPSSIVTYADKRYSDGRLYRNFGMMEVPNDALNYFYFDKHEMVRYSRHKFQKHKLSKILPTYNKELSESDNMKLAGYEKIWDCGNYKFVWYKNEETQGSSAPWVSD
jgi:hypothetical protein